MRYNTLNEPLKIKEYGRHIDNLIKYAMTLEDKEKRQKVAEGVVQLMGQMNPHLRNIEEFRHKLWDHLFLMSDFKLEADSPYPIPTGLEEVQGEKPRKVTYPQSRLKFRHYGKNVEVMIKKAIEMEDAEKKSGYADTIGNYMKMVYKNWNRDSVTDEQIKQDLTSLSNGELSIADNTNLDTLAYSNRPKRKPAGKDNNRRTNTNSNQRNSNNKRNNNNNNRKRNTKN